MDQDLKRFFDDLISFVDKNYSDEVISIVLFGSASTGEWIKGKSDIDFIVVVKNRIKKQEVQNALRKVIYDLDQKMKLGLQETCVIYKRSKNPILNLIYKIEDFFFFGAPFIVLSIDQIDFKKGSINDIRVKLITSFFDSLSMFIYKIKSSSIVLYGDNLIDKFNVKRNKIEKIKASLSPIFINFTALLLLSFNKINSLDHSVKSTLWACEDALFALDKEIPLKFTETFELIRIMFNFPGLENHLSTTLNIKIKKNDDIGFMNVLKYLLNTSQFITRLYINVIIGNYTYNL